MGILQNIIFPSIEDLDKKTLFLRSDLSSINIKDIFTCSLKEDSILDLATYFNILNPKKWKEATSIKDFSIFLEGKGEIECVLLAYKTENKNNKIWGKKIQLQTQGEFFEIPSEILLEDILLGEEDSIKFFSLEIKALTEVDNLRASWHTSIKPLREPKLAGVITTFKRFEAVQKAIDKFKQQIIPYLSPEKIQLLVIDNGKDLLEGYTEGVTIFNNKNLGGAGGFTRGIMEAKRLGFSHALLMDDDASSHPESVFRAYTLLSYFKDVKTAISGAMLLEDKPYIQHEKGGYFNQTTPEMGNAHPLGINLDLSKIQDIILNDIQRKVIKANYGAWWFFSFSLDQMDHFTFPFFVRGDDIFFSLVNKFNIFTMNGIVTWCESFNNKINPFTEYLTYRGLLGNSFFFQEETIIKENRTLFFKHTIKRILFFRYGEANAILEAFLDVLKGPKFFGDNPNPIFKIKNLSKIDKGIIFTPNQKESLLDLQEEWINSSKKNLKRFLYIITLAGFFSKKSKSLFYTPFIDNYLVPTRKSRAIVQGFNKDQLTLYPYSHFLFLFLFFKLFYVSFISFIKFKSICKKYKKEVGKYSSQKYWEVALFKKSIKDF